MRTLKLIFTSLVFLSLFSCTKNDGKNNDLNNDVITEFSELQVPPNFDWSSTARKTIDVFITIEDENTDKIDGSPLDLLDQEQNRLERMTIKDGHVKFYYRVPKTTEFVRIYSPATNRSLEVSTSEKSVDLNIGRNPTKQAFTDSDGDGVADAFDDYPNEKGKAYRVSYPASRNSDYQALEKSSYAVVAQDFESGDRNIERQNCYQFWGTSISSNNAISGSYSGRTGQLSSMTNTNQIITPWIELNGSGTIDFKHKLDKFNGVSKHLDVFLIDADDQSEILIYDIDYQDKNLNDVSLPISWNGIYQVKFEFYGQGGSSRGLLDDISVSGTFASDLQSNNGTGVCDPESQGGGGGGSQNPGPQWPGGSDYAYQIFEDLWPSKGDYDFNDLVLANKLFWIRDADNNIVGGEITTIVKAVGASIDHGLGMEFFKSNPGHTELTYMNDVVSFGDNVEADPNVNNGVKLFENIRDFQHMHYSNTGALGPDAEPDTLTYEFSIPAGVTEHLEILVYMFETGNEELQVRTYGAPPTASADMSYFGTNHDASPTMWDWTVGSGFAYPLTGEDAFYRNDVNHPWGIEFIDDDFKVAVEKTSILSAYPQFQQWAESGGAVNNDWYNNPSDSHIYIPDFE